MGVFPYSHERGTYCDLHYEDTIPQEVKRSRALELMALQKQIYQELNDSLVNTTERMIIDEIKDNCSIGRGERSTPMADPKVIIHSEYPLTQGDFYNVRLTKTLGKDMEGVIVNR